MTLTTPNPAQPIPLPVYNLLHTARHMVLDVVTPFNPRHSLWLPQSLHLSGKCWRGHTRGSSSPIDDNNSNDKVEDLRIMAAVWVVPLQPPTTP